MICSRKFISFCAVLLSVVIHLGFIYSHNTNHIDDNSSEFVALVKLVKVMTNVVKEALPGKVVKKSVPLNVKEGAGEFREEDRAELIKKYLLYLREEIEKHKYQPMDSIYYNLIGNVKVSFDIVADGSFANVQIIRSSGDSLLDKTARNAIAHADGRYERPSWSGRKQLSVAFILKYQYGL